MRVPVEQDNNTVKVELNVPKGVNVANVAPVEGFKHQFKKDKKGNITKITWKATGKGIGPNEFIEFPIVAANPEDEGTFKWKAYQTYDNGDVVKWTGKENSEHPAPTTTVKKVQVQMIINLKHLLQMVEAQSLYGLCPSLQ